jgi:hypothetical protein
LESTPICNLRKKNDDWGAVLKGHDFSRDVNDYRINGNFSPLGVAFSRLRILLPVQGNVRPSHGIGDRCHALGLIA